MADYRDFSISFDNVMEYLEFSDEDRHFFEAFYLPQESSEWKRVRRKGKEITQDYLFIRWKSGDGPGIFTNKVSQASSSVWEIKPTDRKELLAKWTKVMI